MFFVVFLLTCQEHAAFQIPPRHGNQRCASIAVSLSSEETIDSLFGPRIDDGDDVVLYSDRDGGDDKNWGAPMTKAPEPMKTKKAMSRWDSLNPKIKARIVKEAQERAIRNKKKREPVAEKKRRELFYLEKNHYIYLPVPISSLFGFSIVCRNP